MRANTHRPQLNKAHHQVASLCSPHAFLSLKIDTNNLLRLSAIMPSVRSFLETSSPKFARDGLGHNAAAQLQLAQFLVVGSAGVSLLSLTVL